MEIKKHTDLLWYLPLAGLLSYFIAASANTPIGDFGNYYYGSSFLARGDWGLWIYDPASFNLAVYEEGQRVFFLNYTPVPPLSALVYVPFTWLDVKSAKLCWNLLNAALLLIASWRMQQHYRLPRQLILFIPFLFFTPIRSIIYEGQSYFLLLFLLSEGLIRYKQQQKWAAVLLWAFAIHLKISPAFVLLFLVFEKDWKCLLQQTAVIILLLLISLPAIGTAVWYDYLVHILPRLFNGEINNTYAASYQSMQVMLKKLFVTDDMHNPQALYNNPAAYHKLLLAFKLIIYGVAILCSLTQTKTEIKFSVWLIASLLVSGYGNSFSLLLLLIPLACFYNMLTNKRPWFILMVIMVFLITNVPVSWFSSLPVAFQFPRLLFMLLLFLLCAFFIRVTLRPYYFLIPLAALFLPVNTSSYTNNYFLAKEEALLVYGFEPGTNNKIIIHYFDAQGPQKKSVPVQTTVKTARRSIPLQASPGERISVSYVINDSLLVYLSDKKRGVGFYTLRCKQLNQNNE